MVQRHKRINKHKHAEKKHEILLAQLYCLATLFCFITVLFLSVLCCLKWTKWSVGTATKWYFTPPTNKN